MTDEQVLAFYKELEEWYGENLANFEHHPRQFAQQVKLYRYYKERRGKENSTEIPVQQ
jgi:hypothetical protein